MWNYYYYGLPNRYYFLPKHSKLSTRSSAYPDNWTEHEPSIVVVVRRVDQKPAAIMSNAPPNIWKSTSNCLESCTRNHSSDWTKAKQQDKISNTRPQIKALDEKQSTSDGCFKPKWIWFVSRRTTDSQEILSAGIGRPDKTNDLQQTKWTLRIHYVV